MKSLWKIHGPIHGLARVREVEEMYHELYRHGSDHHIGPWEPPHQLRNPRVLVEEPQKNPLVFSNVGRGRRESFTDPESAESLKRGHSGLASMMPGREQATYSAEESGLVPG